MKKCMVVLATVGVFVLSLASSVLAADLVWQDISRGNINVRTVLASFSDPLTIYIGTEGSVLKTEDGGNVWRMLLLIKGQNRAVNDLLIDPQNANCIYAATGNGLFVSYTEGSNWKRIFKGRDYLENEATSVLVFSHAVLLGTKAGLFISKDMGRSWNKELGELGEKEIVAIICNKSEPDCIYVVCKDSVFKSIDKGLSWNKVFLSNSLVKDNDDFTEEESTDTKEGEGKFQIRHIVITDNDPIVIYLATSEGVYKSADGAKSWVRIPSFGLLGRDIRFLMIIKNTLYAVLKSGVFEYKQDRWYELTVGLAGNNFYSLVKDKEDTLYLTCDKGLFKSAFKDDDQFRQNAGPSGYLKNEPSVQEIQKAAMRYAEVEIEKIRQWRSQAAKKAWLPTFSTGINRDIADLWHWETGSTTKAEDDILRKGRSSLEWDVRLSWDLGELIWNDDQTSIDVRSRLLVQLRDDVLDEVTKLYFERLRVKVELDNLTVGDKKNKIEKELKLNELTAMLDGLTDGYFSRNIADSNVDNNRNQ